MAKIKKAHLLALAVFFSVIFLLVLFLLLSELFSLNQPGLNKETEKAPLFNPMQSKAAEEDLLGLFVFNALSANSIENCEGKAACKRLFLVAEKECAGNAYEEIFCLAVIDENSHYCKWIDLNWYSITCTAFFEKNPAKCLEIGPTDERAPCIKDMAVNRPDIDCSVLPSDWTQACEAFKTNDKEKCDGVESNGIQSACRSLLN